MPADQTPEAREHARGWLAGGNRAVVRINGDGTPWHDADVAMIAGLPGFVVAVMVPKAERRERLVDLSVTLPPGTGIIPLVETAAGILNAPAVCAAPGVLRPAFGSVDLSAQLGVDHQSRTALQHARSALVLAATAAGCAAPADGVTTGLADEESLRADLAHALALGFTGKLCVHPRQVAPANECLTPSDAELEWARQVVAAGRSGAATVHDGQMIDRPVMLRAEAILARQRAVQAVTGSADAK